MTDPTSARLFIALWPDAGMQAALAAHAGAWAWSRGARREPAQRLHVTLHFIGPVAREEMQAVGEAIDVPFEPFVLTLRYGEVFRGGAAVLLADAVPDALRALHASIGERLARLGLALDARRWRPHVTLGRSAAGSTPPGSVEAIEWRVDTLALVESLAAPRRYVVRRRVAAKAAL